MKSIERDDYEGRVAKLFAGWQREIDRLRANATHRPMTGTVGDEQTEAAKLQGQLEMALVQFDELRAADTAEAWRQLQIGVDKKIAELDATLARLRAHIAEAD